MQTPTSVDIFISSSFMSENSPSPTSLKKPKSVPIIAVLILLESVFGICCGSLGIISMQTPLMAETLPTNYMKFVYVQIAISLLLTIYALFASIGMLMNKEWSRFHIVRYAVVAGYFLLIQATVDNAYFGFQWKLEGDIGIVGFAFEIIMYIVYLTIYAFTHFFMTKRDVRDYFGS